MHQGRNVQHQTALMNHSRVPFLSSQQEKFGTVNFPVFSLVAVHANKSFTTQQTLQHQAKVERSSQSVKHFNARPEWMDGNDQEGRRQHFVLCIDFVNC